MHTCTQPKRLSVTWLLVGGSVRTLDKEKRKDSREKGDERGPSACLAAMQPQPEGTREKKSGLPKIQLSASPTQRAVRVHSRE